MVLLTGIVRLVIAIPAVVKSLPKRLYSIATVKVHLRSRNSRKSLRFQLPQSSAYSVYGNKGRTHARKSGGTNGYNLLGTQLWPCPFYGCGNSPYPPPFLIRKKERIEDYKQGLAYLEHLGWEVAGVVADGLSGLKKQPYTNSLSVLLISSSSTHSPTFNFEASYARCPRITANRLTISAEQPL